MSTIYAFVERPGHHCGDDLVFSCAWSACAVFFVSAACLAVSIETFHGGMTYSSSNLPFVYPPQTLYHVFGFSFILAWICFSVFIISGFIFLINSRKDKTTDKDQPVNIGR